MRRFTKTLFLFGLGVATGVAIAKNKEKIRKEIKRLVKQGKIKASEGKVIADELIKDAKAKAKEKQKELENKIKAEVNKKLKKLKSKLKPKKRKK